MDIAVAQRTPRTEPKFISNYKKDTAMLYKKTELGQSALHNRSLALTPRQRSAFIMFDGKRSVEEVIKATAGLGVNAEDVSFLLRSGLLAQLAEQEAPAPQSIVQVVPSASRTSRVQDQLPNQLDQAHYSKAYPIATRLTASLGLRGFRLNLAVEAAGDLRKLQELAPKIKEAVGPEKFLELEDALFG